MVGNDITDIEILNHFYIQGMGMNRKDNPCLSGFNFAFKGDDTLQYVQKKFELESNQASFGKSQSDEKSYSHLEKMLSHKKYYYRQTKESGQVENQQDEKKDAIDLIKLYDQFDKNTELKEHVVKVFNETMQLEYELLSAYTPNKLVSAESQKEAQENLHNWG